MSAIDLSAIPAVDDHCHGLYREPQHADAPAWRRLFTESRDPGMARDHVASTLFYRRLLRALAEFLGCAPTEEAMLAARRAYGRPDGGEHGSEGASAKAGGGVGGRDGHGERTLAGALLRAAHLEALLIDGGYPPPELVLPDAEVAALAGCRVAPVLRLEVAMERLIAAHATLEAVEEALGAELADVRGRGYVALKSIAAYRGGLAIRGWPRDEARAAFAAARGTVEREGAVRLEHRPLRDTLLRVAFAEAARQEVPVQFHAGYGDTDADLLDANPLHLRGVLETPDFRGMPVVVLHAAYPYTREGGYLAAVYANVHLDLSYGIPFLGLGEQLALTRAALGVAPVSKLLYSSDGIGVAELHWMGARDGRRALGQALGECVAVGELSRAEAEAAGAAILRENAVRLYGL